MASKSLQNAADIRESRQDAHTLKRIFIGPMLESDVSPIAVAVTFTSNFDNPAEGRGLRRFIHINAKEYFLRRGGREEDWGENAENQELENVLKSWFSSEWGKVYRVLRRKKANASKDSLDAMANLQSWAKYKWVGSTFEVGDFMGVNMLSKTLTHSPQSQRTTSYVSTRSRKTSQHSEFSSIPSAPPSPSPRRPSTRPLVSTMSNTSTYATAKSSPSAAMPSVSKDQISSDVIINSLSFPDTPNTPLLPKTPPRATLKLPVDDKYLQIPSPGTTGTSPEIRSSRSVYFSLPDVSKSRRDSDRHGKGKAKAASGENIHPNGHTNLNILEDRPASPDTVLARTGSQINEASAGATVDSTNFSQTYEQSPGPLILRGKYW